MPTHANLIDHTGGRRPKAATSCFVHFVGMCGHGIGILPRIRNEQGATRMQQGAIPANYKWPKFEMSGIRNVCSVTDVIEKHIANVSTLYSE